MAVLSEQLLLETLMRRAPLSISFWDCDLRFVRINDVAAQSNALAVEEHLGRTFREVVGADVADVAEPMLRRVLETGEPVLDLDVAARWPTGESKVFRATFYPIETEGRRLGVGALGLDITELRRLETDARLQAEQREREASRARVDAEITQAQARRDADEYHRALRHYGQLMRHRLANPLTAIKGTLQTLCDLELDRAVQKELLSNALTQTAALEHVAVVPEPNSPEEEPLVPLPRADSEYVFLNQGAATQKLFQRENERVVATHPTDVDDPVTFICECAASHCSSPLHLPLREYYRVHQDPFSGVVLPGHEVPALEAVIERHDGWWVVRKYPDPPQQAAVEDHLQTRD